MNELFDALLRRPLSLDWLRALLFATFALHMIFALFTIGTAVLVVFYFLQGRWGGRATSDARDWLHAVLDVFLAHKALAVVLGVGPLLLIQVGFTLPFFTAVHLFAPFWLGIILFLIASFFLLDYVGRHPDVHPRLKIPLAALGLALLLAVPGTFVAVLTTTENSPYWPAIVRAGYRLPLPLALHWLARFAHVLAAGIAFASMFFYLLIKDPVRRRALAAWAGGALAAQVLIGIALLLSLPVELDAVGLVLLAAGVLAGLALLWLAVRAQAVAPEPVVEAPAGPHADDETPHRLRTREAGLASPFARRDEHSGAPTDDLHAHAAPSFAAVRLVVPLGLLLLVAMLLTRQTLQDRHVLPLNGLATDLADGYRAVIAPERPAALERYDATLQNVYNTGPTIYENSCAFCHGKQADGQGAEAANLRVAPEVLSAVRSDPAYLRARVLEGVRGSAMPYFTIFTGGQIDALLTDLNERYQIMDKPERVSATVGDAARAQAQSTFANTCSACHAMDGSGQGATAAGMTPPPPDFRHWSLTPQRTFKVITAGYPGTSMMAFGGLPEEERWALVSIAQSFRQ